MPPFPAGLRQREAWGRPQPSVLRPRAGGKESARHRTPGRACWGWGWGRGSGRPVCSPQIQHTEDMENEIDELLQEFEEKSGRAFLHTVCFY